MRSAASPMNSSRRRATVGALLAAVALGMAVPPPPSADAAPSRYVYEVCDSSIPGGGTPGVRFVVNPGTAIGSVNNCFAPGGALSIIQWDHVFSTYAFWDIPVAAPPGGRVESVAIAAQACGGPGNKIFVFEQGWPANCLGESKRTFPIQSSFFTGFLIWLGCDGNYSPGCSAGPNVSVRYIAATEVDPIAPKLSLLQGSLLTGGVLRGKHSLSVEATDVGGGLSNVSISVNGLPAAQPSVPNCNLIQAKNLNATGTVAATVVPCPTSLKPAWTLNTAAYPFHDGVNSIEVCASDFSTLGEPNRTCSALQNVEVDNSCAESSVIGGEVLSAQFAESHDEQITVPFERPATITGELANSAGDPIPGATICVQMQTQAEGHGLAPVATTTTDARGQFSYEVAPGPNRRVMLGYRHNTFQIAKSVHYFARVRPSLKLRPKRVKIGGRIRISGRVPGPDADGRVVVLQAGSPHSSKWYPFREVTTNSQGVYRASYRLDETTRTTTYRIRAVVIKQRDYAWETGHSRPALVEVHE